LEHDLFPKPVSTFRDHALGGEFLHGASVDQGCERRAFGKIDLSIDDDRGVMVVTCSVMASLR
jgi:hypothetical protein